MSYANSRKLRRACERLPLNSATKRRLWSESGGYCMNPVCGAFLFDDAAGVDFAEMAHIIAAASGGPRDVDTSQPANERRADHSNIAVLCANCHTRVDKAPSTYPTELLKQWKARHEDTLKRAFGTPVFSTREACRAFIRPLLEQNQAIFAHYGPTIEAFSEARASQWHRHVVATIVPNNAAIGRVLTQNRALLKPQERHIADIFSIHALEFASRHLLNEWTAGSIRFPEGMETILDGEDDDYS